MKYMEGSARIRPANGSRSSVVHGVGRERESELRERGRVGAGGWRGDVRLQCGVLGWPGMSSTVGTWRRPTNLGLGVVETRTSRTVRRPKRTVSEAGCYSHLRYYFVRFLRPLLLFLWPPCAVLIPNQPGGCLSAVDTTTVAPYVAGRGGKKNLKFNLDNLKIGLQKNWTVIL